MKYQCEICGAIFLSAEECRTHEILCREHNEKALFIKEEAQMLINTAEFQKINFGIEIEQSLQDDSGNQKKECKFYSFDSAAGVDYLYDKNKIIMHVKETEVKNEKDVQTARRSTKKAK